MVKATLEKDSAKVNRKILSISSKWQITIPQKFYQLLGFGDKAECVVRDNALIIRPVKIVFGEDFAEQILTELISQGLSGKELLNEFKKKQKQIRPALEAMLLDAKRVAEGEEKYASYDDVFGMEDWFMLEVRFLPTAARFIKKAL